MLSVTCLSLLVSFRQRQKGLRTPRLTGVLPPAMSNAAVGGPLEFGFAWVCDSVAMLTVSLGGLMTWCPRGGGGGWGEQS